MNRERKKRQKETERENLKMNLGTVVEVIIVRILDEGTQYQL